jgi:hypothetical protein
VVRSLVLAVIVILVGCGAREPKLSNLQGGGSGGGSGGAGGAGGVAGSGAAGGVGGLAGNSGAGGASDSFLTAAEWTEKSSEWVHIPAPSDDYGCRFYEARRPTAWQQGLAWSGCGPGCKRLDFVSEELGMPASDALSSHSLDGQASAFVALWQRVEDAPSKTSLLRTIRLDDLSVIDAVKRDNSSTSQWSVCSVARRPGMALHARVAGGPPQSDSEWSESWSTLLPKTMERIWRDWRVNVAPALDAFDADDGTVFIPVGAGLEVLPTAGEPFLVAASGTAFSGVGAGNTAWWLAFEGAVSSLWSWAPGRVASKHVDFNKPTCDLDATLSTLAGWSSTLGCTQYPLADLMFWTASTSAPGDLRWSAPVALPERMDIAEMVTSDSYAAVLAWNIDEMAPRGEVWIVNLADFSVRRIPPSEGESRRARLAATPRYLYVGDIEGPPALSSITTIVRYDLEHLEDWSVPLSQEP